VSYKKRSIMHCTKQNSSKGCAINNLHCVCTWFTCSSCCCGSQLHEHKQQLHMNWNSAVGAGEANFFAAKLIRFG